MHAPQILECIDSIRSKAPVYTKQFDKAPQTSDCVCAAGHGHATTRLELLPSEIQQRIYNLAIRSENSTEIASLLRVSAVVGENLIAIVLLKRDVVDICRLRHELLKFLLKDAGCTWAELEQMGAVEAQLVRPQSIKLKQFSASR